MIATELASLLADASQGGPYFIDARDRAAMVEAAVDLGFAVVSTDLLGVHGTEAAFARILPALAAPAAGADGWDALREALDAPAWGDRGGLLLFDHSGDWRDDDPEGFGHLLRLLEEGAQRRAGAGQPLWALFPMPSEGLRAEVPSRHA